MRFGFALNVAAAGLLVVPAVAPRGGDTAGLQEALARTVDALEELAGLRAAGSAPPVERVLRATEPPLADLQERSQRLERLRGDVARLQQTFDERLAGAAPAADSAPLAGPPAPRADAAGDDAGRGSEPAAAPTAATTTTTTTGLDDAALRALAEIRPPEPAAPEPRPSDAPTELPPHEPRRWQPQGFSADPARHARAYFRAGRYVEGLELLESVARTAQTDYWRARCLERLNRIDEAVAAYRAVAEAPDAGALAERAAADLDFLEWRRDFEVTRGGGSR